MFGGVQTLGLTALLREVVTSVLVPFMHCKGHAGRSRADLEGPSSTRALREHRVATLAHPANQSPACRDGQQLVNGPAALLRPSVQSTVSVPAHTPTQPHTHTPTTKRDPRFPLVAPWKKSEKKKERKKKKKKSARSAAVAPLSQRIRPRGTRASISPVRNILCPDSRHDALLCASPVVSRAPVASRPRSPRSAADMAPRPSLARRTLAPAGEHIYELGVVGRCVTTTEPPSPFPPESIPVAVPNGVLLMLMMMMMAAVAQENRRDRARLGRPRRTWHGTDRQPLLVAGQVGRRAPATAG